MAFRYRIILLLLFVPFLLTAQEHHYADSLRTEIVKCASDTHRVTLLNLAAKYWSDYDQDSGIVYAQKAIALGEKTGFLRGEAWGHMNYGLCLGGKGNFIQEISQHNKALAQFLEAGDTLYAAKAAGNVAIAEYRIGDYPAATQHCLDAISYYNKIADEWGVAVCKMTLGNVYLDQKNYTEAMNCYLDALDINARTDNNPMFTAQLRVNIGNIYNLQERYDTAMRYYRSAIPELQKASDYYYAALLNNMGTVLRSQQKYDSAQVVFRECVGIRLLMQDSDGICSVYQNLGNNFTDLGQFDSALYYLNTALEIANKIHTRSQVSSTYHALATTYAAMHDYEKAFAYQSKYIALNDSLTGAENTEAVNTLRENFDAARREQQIRELETTNKYQEAKSDRNIALLAGGILVALAFVALLYYRNRVKQVLNVRLEKQNAEISMQKKAITDSINYAKKIQDSILPPDAYVKKLLPDSFIYYAPKDVVSGDFYWVEAQNGHIIFAAVDCTGHGVPGALMSVVGFNLMTQAVNEMKLTKPSDILFHLDHGVNKLLRQSETGNVKDGMDLAVCSLNPAVRSLQYAGVFNPLYVVSNGQLNEVRADKSPIGINVDGITDTYTNHEVQLKSGDMIYLFTDGFADQFGGGMGKKYKYKKLRDLLVSMAELPVDEQQQRINSEFLSWKGGLEQVDDVLVMGVRIH